MQIEMTTVTVGEKRRKLDGIWTLEEPEVISLNTEEDWNSIVEEISTILIEEINKELLKELNDK